MPPKDFHHPFQPYTIQQQFMEAMYECIENGRVGIFESPTGTGKSLSLICSSLTWLREHKRKAFDEARAAVQIDDDEPDWMAEHAVESTRREMRQMREEFETRLQAAREEERKLKDRYANGAPSHKRRKLADDQDKTAQDEEQFVLDDYDSSDERERTAGSNQRFSADTAKLMENLGMLQSTKKASDASELNDELKIFFCSRTHSQLSQLAGELQRVSLPPAMPPEDAKTGVTEIEDVKQLSLGSRKNLCINAKVLKLNNQTAINERCVELQQSITPSDHKCAFLPNKENEKSVLDFCDHALAAVRDIEELAELGTRLGICPYYASRPAIGPAELVTLPYPLLLQKTAREALGINLAGHVVIIDEAHNLMNAVEGIHSVKISERQLKRAHESLIVYLQKFRNRLKGGNRVYVAQVVRVIDSMLAYTVSVAGAKESGGSLFPSQLLSEKGVDQVNLAKLVRYINDSKLARKVERYVSYIAKHEHIKTGVTQQGGGEADIPTLTHVQNFLMTLMNPSKEGRFFWSRDGDNVAIKYMLLDPSEHFRDIVHEARAVILAGGTMSPMDDYRQQLFPYLPSLTTFSCGHLIPPSNLLVRTIAADQAGPLEFNFKSRNANAIDRIGNAVMKLAATVTGGLVIFLPSYGFLEQVSDRWRSGTIASELEKQKPIFWDSRGGSAETTFRTYSQAISTQPKGAILLSVIGGKLSEGINFSDDLGRCVVVVGLPFPNLETPEWKAKLQYLDEKAAVRGEPKGKASREHAENVCMRAVNQAVGRVIRHKDDWASIVLMDSRYDQKRIREKLPGWIKESFPAESSSSLEGVIADAAVFFEGRAHR